MGFPGGLKVKNLPNNAEDAGLIPRSGRSPGEGNGNPLQYTCLENSMDTRRLAGCGPWDHKRVGHDSATKQQMFKELKQGSESTISKSQKRNKWNKKEENANSRDDYNNWKDDPEIWDGTSSISELENQSKEIIQSKEQKNWKIKKDEWSQKPVGEKKQIFNIDVVGFFEKQK